MFEMCEEKLQNKLKLRLKNQDGIESSWSNGVEEEKCKDHFAKKVIKTAE